MFHISLQARLGYFSWKKETQNFQIQNVNCDEERNQKKYHFRNTLTFI